MREPAIELTGIRELWRGSRAQLELVVTPGEPLEITGIDVALRGSDGWQRAGELAHRVVHLERTRRVIGPALLHPEPHRFPLPLALPAMLAPTHALAPATSRLDAVVRIGVPRFWRLDLRRRFALEIREPPPATLDRTAIAARGPVRDGAHLELALAARTLVAGEVLVGSCAAFAVDDARPREIVLALTPWLTLIDGERVHRCAGPPHTLAIPLPAGAAGRALQFSFALPRELAPTFRADTHALAWTFTARLETRRQLLEAELPVTIVDPLAASRVEPLREAPVIAGASIGPYR